MKKKLLVISVAAALLMMSGCGNSSEYDVQEITGDAVAAEEGQAVSLVTGNNDAAADDADTADENPLDDTERDTASDSDSDSNNTAEKETAVNPKNEPAEKTEKKSDTAPTRKDSGQIRINGKTLRIGMTITDSFISSLGTPDDIQNAPSCHYDGSDTIYCYNGYSLYTYANGSNNYLYLVEIDGSGISSELGIHVGSSVDDVKSAYGNPSSETGTSLVYNLSNCIIRFYKSGSSVTGINYEEK